MDNEEIVCTACAGHTFCFPRMTLFRRRLRFQCRHCRRVQRHALHLVRLKETGTTFYENFESNPLYFAFWQ